MAHSIHTAMTMVKDKLVEHFNTNGTPTEVQLGNIALMDTAAGNDDIRVDNRVVISLVNVEEESTLKNNLHFRRNQTTGTVDYENPPVNLNLYLLFSANLNLYEEALKRLSLIIQAFQGENHFTRTTDDERIEITLDLYTLTFEQINHLWGSLGGKQVPSVMYKTRMVSITDRRKLGTGKLIEIIEGNASKL